MAFILLWAQLIRSARYHSSIVICTTCPIQMQGMRIVFQGSVVFASLGDYALLVDT
jgi:hypothetical protein